ncbi:hypothetical protein [Lacinutrix undariae]
MKDFFYAFFLGMTIEKRVKQRNKEVYLYYINTLKSQYVIVLAFLGYDIMLADYKWYLINKNGVGVVAGVIAAVSFFKER